MAKPSDPQAVLYKRWRNRRFGYLVDVQGVRDFQGATSYREVSVRRVKGHGSRTWPAEVFLRSFEPVGRKMRKRTAWELLQE